MSLFSLTQRDKLQSTDPATQRAAVVEELDNLTAQLSAWALVNHNEDGTHNTKTTSGLDFVPVGGMIYWPTSTAPLGWILTDGSPISRAAFPLLFKAIGISAGAGDGSTTFNLPNVANHIILAA